jgi:DNA adenine methylase
MTTAPKPLLKWVGGKSKLLDSLTTTFPRTMRNYREPFVGGGSVLFAVLALVQRGEIVVEGNIFASDANAALIAFYKNVQSSPTELAREITRLSHMYAAAPSNSEVNEPDEILSKEGFYYWVRTQYNTETEHTIPRSAQFLFLNKTCFRGMFREGPRGFNVPFGNYAKIEFPSEEMFIATSEFLHPVIFETSEFIPVLTTALPGDFIYMDPPYVPETATSFVKYTASGFPMSYHDALFTLAREMADRGVGWTMSNADRPEVRAAFTNEKCRITPIQCRRAINAKNPAATAPEVIISVIYESTHPDA